MAWNCPVSRSATGGARQRELNSLVDNVFTARGPAAAVWLASGRLVRPASWMSLSGRSQLAPDRNTRGYLDAAGHRHWLDVFPEIPGAPQRVGVVASGQTPSPVASGQTPSPVALLLPNSSPAGGSGRSPDLQVSPSPLKATGPVLPATGTGLALLLVLGFLSRFLLRRG